MFGGFDPFAAKNKLKSAADTSGSASKPTPASKVESKPKKGENMAF